MDDLLDVMYARRSVRHYTDQEVSGDQVQAMLKAAMAAPSAMDFRPWHFVVVRKRKLLDKLSETHKYAHMLAKAPLAIVVCGDSELSERHWVEDTCAATQNLLLAVTTLGLGGVWISVYPNKKRQKYVRQVLDLPDSIGVLCLVAVGYPSEDAEDAADAEDAKEKGTRAKYDPARIHYEKWKTAKGE